MKEVTMSKEQLKLYHLALKVIEGDLMLKDFAVLAGPSQRQAIRRVKKIREMDFIGHFIETPAILPETRGLRSSRKLSLTSPVEVLEKRILGLGPLQNNKTR
jgi:hypothetical protein